MRRYYSNIVGKYSRYGAEGARETFLGDSIRDDLPAARIGVAQRSGQRVIGLYDRWSCYEAEDGVVVIYASMYGNTAQMADYIARRIAEAGVRNKSGFTMCRKRISLT